MTTPETTPAASAPETTPTAPAPETTPTVSPPESLAVAGPPTAPAPSVDAEAVPASAAAPGPLADAETSGLLGDAETPVLLAVLAPLLAAESDAEAPAAGIDPGDLEQAVWLRLLERLQETGAPERPADWLRRAVRAEARRARRTTDRERPYEDEPAPPPDTEGPHGSPETSLLVAERHRTLRAAVTRTPGRCPSVLTAMLDPQDPTYREIAGELGISQGSLGPMRSRCLGCLRRMLAAEVPAPGRRGRVR